MPRHDNLWKDLLRTFFADLLGLTAPEVVPRAIEFLDKEIPPADPRRSRRDLDLLARVICAVKGALLVHTEIELRHRKATSRRMWRYFFLLQARHEEPVHSVLINLRGGPAGISRRTLEDRSSGQLRAFEYTVVGLSGTSASELLARPEPLAWALAALTRNPKARRAQLKLACHARIEQARLSPREKFLLVNCVETYLELRPEEAAELEALRSLEPARKEVVTMDKTWAGRIKAEAQKIGLEKGLEQGKAKGARQVLLHLLQRRFGQLPAAVERKVEAIRSLTRIEVLAERVLVAGSLAEMGLE